MKPLEFQRMENRADSRGDSYYIPREAIDFVDDVDEIHFATIVPGATRGNHYHAGRREFIFVTFGDTWRLAWAPLGTEERSTEDFEGQGALLIQVQPKVVHAIKNTGKTPIHLTSFSNKRHDPGNPDTFREVLLE